MTDDKAERLGRLIGGVVGGVVGGAAAFVFRTFEVWASVLVLRWLGWL